MKTLKRSCIVMFWMAALFEGIARGNVVGNGNQNFNSIPSGLDFVTVQSSETLKPGIINLGLFLNYAVNTLPYFDGGNQNRTTFNDTLLGMDMNVGIGITDNFDMGISFPFILAQSIGNDAGYHGEFFATGNSEVRLLGKYRFYGNDDGGMAFVGSVDFDRTKDNPYTGLNPGPIYNLELAMDTTVNRWALGLNLGYRIINAGDPVPGSFFEPLGNQYIASVGASYLLSRIDTKLIFEIFASQPAVSKASNPDRLASSAELLAGVKHDLSNNLAVHAGGGTQLEKGVSSPDWRVYTGLNYAFGPVFKKPPQIYQITGDKIILQAVLFDFDSDAMVGEYDQTLTDVAAALEKMGYKKVVVVGHTDSIGSDEYNQRLSEARASAIKNYLVTNKGFKVEAIDAKGKGKLEPIADNGNFQGRQQNRRVEFTVEK
ncbi:MAG: hypothetical protein C5B49_10100 [Bdellovibrio sp.]|nr:MAG: hypothetical protein C5B49_10100 [Bdellovibrio sp.]